MDRTTELSLIRRVLRHLADKTTDRAATEASYVALDYHDEGRFADEMSAIFKVRPLLVAHVSQVARPGDFVTADILGVPILVVRGASGCVNAFVNICRHRAAQLLTEARGHGLSDINCPYHGWCYANDGQLLSVPDGADSFPGIARARLGLRRLPAGIRGGFVWVKPEPAADAAELDLPDHLGGMDPELDLCRFDEYQFYRSEERTWRFNWKTCVESFLENYHFAVLHKRSTNRIFINNVSAVDRFGPHLRAVAPKRSIADLARIPEDEWELRPHATLLYVIFPNVCLFLEKSHASLVQLFPLTPTTTSVRITHIVADSGIEYRDYWERNISIFMSAVLEDLDMCESMSRGLSAPVPGTEIIFGRNEGACAAFRESVDAHLVEKRAGDLTWRTHGSFLQGADSS